MSAPSGAPVIEISGLTLDFIDARGRNVRVLHGVDLAIGAGETLALVGESGSGKSATSLSVMGLHDRRRSIVGGKVILRDAGGAATDLVGLPQRAMQDVRGRQIAMIFQDPLTSLNPVQRVGTQIGESLKLHRGLRGVGLREAIVEGLREVGIADPARRADAYPHELSGGMRQRVLIALALACDPRLLIADEPTTALDVTVQAQILDVLRALQRARGMAMLFITHNLAVVAQIADRVAVMYGGRIVEDAPAPALFERPRHPYTRALLESLPALAGGEGARRRLRVIPGSVIDPQRPPPGCAFAPRCSLTIDECRAAMPALAPVAPARASRCYRAEML